MSTLKVITFIIIALIIFSNPLLAQTTESESKISLSLAPGYQFRKIVFYNINLTGSSGQFRLDPSSGYSYEIGINGSSLNLSVIPKINSIDLAIRYAFTIRYDHQSIRNDVDDNRFYVDHFVSLMKFIKIRHQEHEKRKYIGIGYGVMNQNAGFDYERRTNNVVSQNSLELEFNAFKFFIGFPVWKINLETGINYAEENFPGPTKDSAIIFFLEVSKPIQVIE